MAYAFTLIFEGVCAFVPDKPIFIKDSGTWKPSPDPPSKMAVLLPDLRLPDVAGFDESVVRSAHYPALRFDIDTLVEQHSSRPVDLVVREFSSSREHGLCLLDREVVSIEIPGRKNPTFKCLATTHGDQPSEDPNERRSLWWLPRMEELDSRCGLARTDLQTSFTMFPDDLVAAVEIDDGLFHCVDFNRSSGEFLKWRFARFGQSGDGAWNRAIGNRMAIRFSDLDEAEQPIRIHLHHRSPADRRTVLELRPRLGRTEIEAEISNLEPEEMFEDSGVFPRAWPDPDFEELYKKVAMHAQQPPFVIPDFGALRAASGSDRKPCAPALFSGFHSQT